MDRILRIIDIEFGKCIFKSGSNVYYIWIYRYDFFNWKDIYQVVNSKYCLMVVLYGIVFPFTYMSFNFLGGWCIYKKNNKAQKMIIVSSLEVHKGPVGSQRAKSYFQHSTTPKGNSWIIRLQSLPTLGDIKFLLALARMYVF